MGGEYGMLNRCFITGFDGKTFDINGVSSEEFDYTYIHKPKIKKSDLKAEIHDLKMEIDGLKQDKDKFDIVNHIINILTSNDLIDLDFSVSQGVFTKDYSINFEIKK